MGESTVSAFKAKSTVSRDRLRYRDLRLQRFAASHSLLLGLPKDQGYTPKTRRVTYHIEPQDRAIELDQQEIPSSCVPKRGYQPHAEQVREK